MFWTTTVWSSFSVGRVLLACLLCAAACWEAEWRTVRKIYSSGDVSAAVVRRKSGNLGACLETTILVGCVSYWIGLIGPFLRLVTCIQILSVYDWPRLAVFWHPIEWARVGRVYFMYFMILYLFVLWSIFGHTCNSWFCSGHVSCQRTGTMTCICCDLWLFLF